MILGFLGGLLFMEEKWSSEQEKFVPIPGIENKKRKRRMTA